ncbi:MAG: hypothetical protein ACLU6Y_09275 [Ruminococcus sp.]
MEKDKHLGLRIDSETHGKLKSLAEFEGAFYQWRSAVSDSSGDCST